MTFRIRAAGKIAALGALVHVVLFDLSLALDSRLAKRAPTTYRPRPWLGVLFILLLVLGAGQVGVLAVEAITFAAHRLQRQDEP